MARTFTTNTIAVDFELGIHCRKDALGNILWRRISDGKIHHPSAPAYITSTGTKEWYRHGARHREDGPAIEGADGWIEWWLQGILYDDVYTWAKDVLRLQGNSWPTQKEIDNKAQASLISNILE